MFQYFTNQPRYRPS